MLFDFAYPISNFWQFLNKFFVWYINTIQKTLCTAHRFLNPFLKISRSPSAWSQSTIQHRVITYLETFCISQIIYYSELKIVLHKSSLKYDFALKMIILRQNSMKKYIKYSKYSNFYRRSQILNCLGFNKYRILVWEINFHWRISMSVKTHFCLRILILVFHSPV